MRLRPHHLLDIITQHGAGVPFTPSPYGHAVHTVAESVLADPDQEIEFVVGTDDICAPCRHLVNGRCDDVLSQLDPPVSKLAYNDGLDRRLLAYLSLPEGSALTCRQFARLVGEHMVGIEGVCTHPGEDAATRRAHLSEGLRRVGG
jgi:hypothetical protein